MTSTPKSTKTREEGPFKIVPGKTTVKSPEPTATHKGGVPILYATWQLMTGATSLSDWIDQVHRAMRTKHPDVADQIKTLERRQIEIPYEPQEPQTPERGSDQEVVEMYKIKVQIYLSQMQVHSKALIVYQSKIEKEENNEKACASEILAYVSDPLIQKVKQDIPELDICSDIPRIITALKKYHGETNAKSVRRIMLHAYLSHAMIKMKADSKGRGGGTRKDVTARDDDDSPPFKPHKTHAARPERANEEECYICEGAFNYLTKDKKHFPKYCPFVSITSKDKKALMTKMLHSNDDQQASTEVAKTSTANKIAKRQSYSRYSDSEDEEDNPYGVIMGTADR